MPHDRLRPAPRAPHTRRRIEEPSILATRVPASLRRAVRVHCVENRIPVQDFVAEALREKLAKLTTKSRRV